MDLTFCAIWIVLLLKHKYWLEFALGLFGVVVNFLVDYGIWFNLQGIRILEGPINPLLFFIYFSITYGMIEYSYVAVMFRARKNEERMLWTFILYLGWLLSGIFSLMIPLNDITIYVAREMAIYRTTQVLVVIGGYFVLVLLKKYWTHMQDVSYQRIIYLFLVGISVHFGMEFTLWAVGIRPGVVSEFLFNSFLEFNSGVPILYVLWTYFNEKAKVNSTVA